MARDLFKAQRYRDAVTVLRELVEGHGQTQLLGLLAESYASCGDQEETMAWLVAAARRYPKNKDMFRWLGALLLKRGDPERAIRVLDRALMIDDRDVEIKRLHDRASRLSKIADSINAPPDPESEALAEQPLVATSLPSRSDDASVVALADNDVKAIKPITKSTAAPPPPPPPRIKKIAQEKTKPAIEAPRDSTQGFEIDEPTRAWDPDVAKDKWDEDEPTFALKDKLSQSRRRADSGFGTIKSLPGITPGGKMNRDDDFDAEEPTETSFMLGRLVGEVLDSQRPEPMHKRPSTRPRVKLEKGSHEESFADALTRVASERVVAPPASDAPEKDLFNEQGMSVGDSHLSDSEFDDVQETALFEGIESAVSGSLNLKPPPSSFAPDSNDGEQQQTQVLSESQPPADPWATWQEGEPQAASEHRQQFSNWSDGQAMERSAIPLVQAIERGKKSPAISPGRSHDISSDALFAPKAPNMPSSLGSLGSSVSDERKNRRVTSFTWMLLTVLLVMAGVFAWHYLMQENREKAKALVGSARHLALAGDTQSLVKAEAQLLSATRNDHQSAAAANLLLFVQMQRALEEGQYSSDTIAKTLNRVPKKEAVKPYRYAALAVIQALSSQSERSLSALKRVRPYVENDPALMYIVARLEQRFGQEDADQHLKLALAGASNLAAARLARVHILLSRNTVVAAEKIANSVLALYPDHLRAQLWATLLKTKGAEPSALLALLKKQKEELARAAATDRFLADLIRVRAFSMANEREKALSAIDSASNIELNDPLLLSLLAKWAQRMGVLDQAKRAMQSALKLAPKNLSLERRMIEVQVQLGETTGALARIKQLNLQDLEGLRLRAHAALLAKLQNELSSVQLALAEHKSQDQDEQAELDAMKLRVALALGQAPDELINEAGRLIIHHPESREVAVALVEIALAAKSPGAARKGISTLMQVARDEVETHYLRARYLRMEGKINDADSALRHALGLLPDYKPARTELADLLTSQGRWKDAGIFFQVPSETLRQRVGRRPWFR
ncbi:MAG: hypothetical protein IPJ88_14245 [Myxococcales bacterium]|nr:MAG: hypothetical protein IPJ88_14245 [Myxococcales bacterium]